MHMIYLSPDFPPFSFTNFLLGKHTKMCMAISFNNCINLKRCILSLKFSLNERLDWIKRGSFKIYMLIIISSLARRLSAMKRTHKLNIYKVDPQE